VSEVDVVERLGELAGAAEACRACRLGEERTQAVFADGSPTADLMFVGEGPGRNEDLQGLPFVGRAGQLLNRLLGDVGLVRADVYIANVVKCRPPGNRDPQPDEIDACKHFLADQIRLVDPVVVMTMGNFSTKLLLKTTTGITRMRGQIVPWWNRVVIPTFHPAAALRNGERMVDTMRIDFQLAVDTISAKHKDAQHPDPPVAEDSADDPEQLGFFP
jgi:DNA polymerase